MTEDNRHQEPPESGTENVGVDDETLYEAAKGREADPEKGTPRISGGGTPGQTQSPAPDDDVGVPEELDDRTE